MSRRRISLKPLVFKIWRVVIRLLMRKVRGCVTRVRVMRSYTVEIVLRLLLNECLVTVSLRDGELTGKTGIAVSVLGINGVLGPIGRAGAENWFGGRREDGGERRHGRLLGTKIIERSLEQRLRQIPGVSHKLYGGRRGVHQDRIRGIRE